MNTTYAWLSQVCNDIKFAYASGKLLISLKLMQCALQKFNTNANINVFLFCFIFMLIFIYNNRKDPEFLKEGLF